MLLNLISSVKLSHIRHECSICNPAILEAHQSTAPVAQGQSKALKVSTLVHCAPLKRSPGPRLVCVCQFCGGFGGKKAAVMDLTQLSYDPLWKSLKQKF